MISRCGGYDLRPYSTSGAANGTNGGTFPYSVVARIQLDGNPNPMTLSADGSKLYVAQDNQDQVAVIDTTTNKITHKIDTRGPGDLDFPANTTGAAPTGVAINRGSYSA